MARMPSCFVAIVGPVDHVLEFVRQDSSNTPKLQCNRICIDIDHLLLVGILMRAASVYSLRLKDDVFERLEFRIEQSLQGFPVRCVRLL